MKFKVFNKEDLKEALWDGSESIEVVDAEIIDTSRWSVIKGMIFKDLSTGLFYQTTYSEGATECQDESPFEYDPDEIECAQVEQVEKLVKVWQEVK